MIDKLLNIIENGFKLIPITHRIVMVFGLAVVLGMTLTHSINPRNILQTVKAAENSPKMLINGVEQQSGNVAGGFNTLATGQGPNPGRFKDMSVTNLDVGFDVTADSSHLNAFGQYTRTFLCGDNVIGSDTLTLNSGVQDGRFSFTHNVGVSGVTGVTTVEGVFNSPTTATATFHTVVNLSCGPVDVTSQHSFVLQTAAANGVIQGCKQTDGLTACDNTANNPVKNAEVRMDAGNSQTTQPYSYQGLTAGSQHTVTILVPNGYSASYVYCYNAIMDYPSHGCKTNAGRIGDWTIGTGPIVAVTVPATNNTNVGYPFVDLHFWFTSDVRPVGYYDAGYWGDPCAIVGWTCDASNFSKPLQTDLYVKDVTTGNNPVFLASPIANIEHNPADPAVKNACGGTNAHDFSFTLPANSPYRDGQAHTYIAAGINIDANGNRKDYDSLGNLMHTWLTKYRQDTTTCATGPSITPGGPTLTPTPTSGSSVCPFKRRGDADCNGVIDINDFSTWWVSQLDTMPPAAPVSQNANFSCVEGNSQTYFVDMTDFEVWRRNTTTGLITPGPISTPTPAIPIPTGPIPNCGGLTGPTQITLGQSGTYTAAFASFQGQLGGEIVAGQSGVQKWNPCYTTGQFNSALCGIAGNYGSLSFTWTPTEAGTYDLFCRAWNDSIAECRGNSAYVDQTPRYACTGPSSAMTVTVVGTAATPTPTPANCHTVCVTGSTGYYWKKCYCYRDAGTAHEYRSDTIACGSNECTVDPDFRNTGWCRTSECFQQSCSTVCD